MRRNKPSKTARKVALITIGLDAKKHIGHILPCGLVEAQMKCLIGSGAASPLTVRLAHSRRMSAIHERLFWMLPGQFNALAYRKAFFDKQVRQHLDLGAKQVLVLGAGYDTLCWRLSAIYPEVNFFEIDHPATGKYKQKGIAALGQRKNLHLIQADLSNQQLSQVLNEQPVWQMNTQCMIVAEGLLMYLQENAVKNLFNQCTSITGNNSRIAFTYLPANKNNQLNVGRWTWLTTRMHRWQGEPWLWSIQPKMLNHFLQEIDWKLIPEDQIGDTKAGIEHYGVAIKK